MTTYQIESLRNDVILLAEYIKQLELRNGNKERIKKLMNKLRFLNERLEVIAA